MIELLWVGLGGALGASSRWMVSLGAGKLLPIPFPWGTIAVNVLGCLAAGFWLGRSSLSGGLPGGGGTVAMQRLFVTGFLGAFTTFSAFALDTISLIKSGSLAFGMINIFLHWFLPLLAAAVGLLLARG